MKDRLLQEDLQKLKHWVDKHSICKSPFCGSKCIIETKVTKDEKEITRRRKN